MSSHTLPPVAAAFLKQVLSADAGADLTDNVDEMRFPDGESPPSPDEAAAHMAQVLVHTPGLQRLYAQLTDDADRELMVRILAYRVLGHRKVQMPLTAPRLRELTAQAAALRIAERTVPLAINGWFADDYDLRGLGYPITLRAFIGALVYTFQLEQYRSPGPEPVAVREGDVVIDGGAYCGDTALYFAHNVGARGRVLSFEFEPGNVSLLRQNLELNPGLASRISVIEAALWAAAGERLAFREMGPGTVIEEGASESTITESVDALVERGGVDRVNFIKLDIEGAELQALRGAQATIRRFRPRLAIAAYHRPDDLAALPAFLDGLGVGYRFRLGHTTMHREETVLFAASDQEPPPPAGRRRWLRRG